jgi:hypothetical protein
MTENTSRSVRIERTSVERYVVHNVRGGSIPLGTGQDDSFTPVELLLAAIGGCMAADVDLITSRRAEPSRFVVEVAGNKMRDEAGGNRMQDLAVVFTCRSRLAPTVTGHARRCPDLCGRRTIGSAPSPARSNSALRYRSSKRTRALCGDFRRSCCLRHG